MEEDEINVKYGEDFFTSLIGKLIFIIPEDGQDPPVTLKVRRFYTEDLIKQLETDPADSNTGLTNYLIDPSNSTKYIAKQITFSDGMYEHIKATKSALESSIERIEIKRKQDLDRYVELCDKIQLVESINGLDPNSEEVELYKLHQVILKRYPDRKPLETDEELCERMKRINVRLYTTAKVIPVGPDYDNCREYLKAYNRLKKKRQAARTKEKEKAKAKAKANYPYNIAMNHGLHQLLYNSQNNLSELVNQGPILGTNTPQSGHILEIVSPYSQSGSVLGIITPQSGPILEIIAPDINQNSLPEYTISNQCIDLEILSSNSESIIPFMQPFIPGVSEVNENFELTPDEIYINKLYHNAQIAGNLNSMDWDALKRMYLELSNLPIDKRTYQQLFILDKIKYIYILTNHTIPKVIR